LSRYLLFNQYEKSGYKYEIHIIILDVPISKIFFYVLENFVKSIKIFVIFLVYEVLKHVSTKFSFVNFKWVVMKSVDFMLVTVFYFNVMIYPRISLLKFLIVNLLILLIGNEKKIILTLIINN